MSKNFIQPGDSIEFTAGANITSGQGVIIGALLGVALGTVSNGAVGVAAIEGVFELPKASGFVVNAGQKLIWDTATSAFVASATTGDLNGCAVAVEGAGSTATKVKAKLCPGAATIT
jgi:predicted RecA/RadA family phage recombinase